MDTWLEQAIKSLFAIIGFVVTGFIGYLWGRKRARERDLLLLWRAAFDRPAFRGPFLHHSSQPTFRRAISTTLKTIATGILFDTGGHELNRVTGVYYGPSQIKSKKRRNVIIEVQGRLQKLIRLSNSLNNSPSDAATIESIDNERDEIIAQMNKLWVDEHIEEMPLPKSYNDPADIQSLVRALQDEERASQPIANDARSVDATAAARQ